MTLLESSSQSVFLFEQDLRAKRFALVARKTGAHFSGSCSRWRTAEALIPSAEAPTRFPIEAGSAPVHCPDGGVTAGLHRNASRRPSAFKAAPARLSGSSSLRFQRIEPGYHDRTRTCILDLRRVVLIQLSYVVMVRRRPQSAAGAVTSRARHPSTGSRARSRAESSAETDAGPPSGRAASARMACAAA